MDHYLLSESKGLNGDNISLRIGKCFTEKGFLDGDGSVVRETNLLRPTMHETTVSTKLRIYNYLYFIIVFLEWKDKFQND